VAVAHGKPINTFCNKFQTEPAAAAAEAEAEVEAETF